MTTSSKPRSTAAGADPTTPHDRFEGDYRPASATDTVANVSARLEPLQIDFLLRLADALNTTLDLNTLMHRVADLERVIKLTI